MDNLNLDMFKAYDIRTKQSKLTDEITDRLIDAVVVYCKNILQVENVIIGRDARLYVPALAERAAEKLTDAGIDVFLNPLPVSTCQFYYTCLQNPSYAGLMFTASHNPGEYVGIKFMAQNLVPLAMGNGPEGGFAKIKDFYINGEKPVKAAVKGRVHIINYLESYIDYCMKLSGVKPDSLKGLKIFLEFLSGSAGAELALAFQKAGADVTVRNVIPNGFFPSGDPNPIIESSIAPARKVIEEGDFDLGFCFDGDGDRMDIMDRDGKQIVPGLNMAIIIPQIMKIYGGTKKHFYADVKAIPSSLAQIAKSGAKIHIIRNGHSFIKAKLRTNCENGYFASEEESAHYYMNFPLDINDFSKGYGAVELTLFFALLTARCYKTDPSAYERAKAIQDSIFRKREWPLYCEAAPEKMPVLMQQVEDRMRELGASVISTMDDGSDLDATLMRFNLPEQIDNTTDLSSVKWCQVAQRISRSEDAMCRWEVVSNDESLCEFYNNEIIKITDPFVSHGFARYGE